MQTTSSKNIGYLSLTLVLAELASRIAQYMNIAASDISPLLVIYTPNQAYLMWLAYLMCVLLIPHTELSSFKHISSEPKKLITSLYKVLCTSFGLYLVHTFVFPMHSLPISSSPYSGLFISLYESVHEEVFLRLILFSTLFLGLRKLFRDRPQNRTSLLWACNVLIASVTVGIHILSASMLPEMTTLELPKMIVIYALPSLVYGQIFWTQGVWVAMIAHFFTTYLAHLLMIYG